LKTIAVIPIHNEERTLADVLTRTLPRVDLLVCVNDGSNDGTLGILEGFSRRNRGLFILDLPDNLGMAGALEQGLLFVLLMESESLAAPEDVVVTIDADGQHRPEYIPPILRYMRQKKADVVLTRRDFSAYPKYKVWGNRFLTWTGSILSGKDYRDVESGLRFLKVKTLEPILRYYTGVQYSCAQEIALVSARAGFRIDNDFLVTIDRYRPGTTVWDGFIVLYMSFLAFWKWRLGIARKVVFDTPLLRRSLAREAGRSGGRKKR
jgi:glycosyltransferase involved in cell wall biosynthesis